MKAFMGSGVGKTVILELDRGDDIVESVEKTLEKEGIKNAYIASAVGSIQHLEYHRPLTMDEATEDEFLSLDGPFETGGVTGTVIDGVAHLHFSGGGVQGIHVGHLEKGTRVLYLMELVVIELEGFALKRVLTPENVKKLFPVSEEPS